MKEPEGGLKHERERNLRLISVVDLEGGGSQKATGRTDSVTLQGGVELTLRHNAGDDDGCCGFEERMIE